MATCVKSLYSEMITAMGVEGLEIPASAVKFFRQEDEIPESVSTHELDDITLTVCQAVKQASLGDAVCLTRDNIGCVAAAITLGLVDEAEDKPLEGPRVYTDIMRDQSGLDDGFVPPTPKEFTEGIVYACRDSGHLEFCMFGEDDSGRYRDVETARTAIRGMTAIQPAVMKAVFFYAPDFEVPDLIPDVVVLSVRPVELARIVQAHQYNTGERVVGTSGAVRVVCSDLITRPYLTTEINISTFCLGARLIAQYEADRLGIGMSFHVFEEIAAGMADSRTGYPYHLYPGASNS
jgi:uncharacterized protein (DUF169 family)